MQTAAQAASSALSSRSSKPSLIESETRDSATSKLSGSLLDNFWLRMAGMFGHTWTSQYGPKPHGIGGDTWATALGGVTPAQLADGLRATLALGGEFPPSAPKFRALCFSIPSLAVVRAEILGRDTARTPFGRLVWQHIDAFRLRHAEAEKADRIVRDAYEIAREHVMRCGALPPEPVAYIGPAAESAPFKPASPETVAAARAKVEAVFAGDDDDAA